MIENPSKKNVKRLFLTLEATNKMMVTCFFKISILDATTPSPSKKQSSSVSPKKNSFYRTFKTEGTDYYFGEKFILPRMNRAATNYSNPIQEAN